MTHESIGRVRGLNVSRETLERLKQFEALVLKWNPKINLIAKSTVSSIWERHVLDSMQVFDCAKHGAHWVDLGSGGGFPGIVIGILAQENACDMRVTLIESDQRKATFLRTAIRETGIEGEVISRRIEETDPQNADILSARALTNLSGLLNFCDRHLVSGGLALFPKGVTWEKEVKEARRDWSFQVEPVPSLTDPEAVILKIEGVSRV
ncbi:16S rRNA (guanine(527)-N(7))-methyltransferase RsmG [Sedimentitalea arenosa]|uniref:Ribosomal RNA small subunit methyltransferase G n=1 Tax=Sedimentitalea arenosa TaxID=2798803 RepID=A0A8J7LWC2_9RHOB|nr:16S rRNA (guanine(527)-N(7))-methyltransferase RsmG [Arenibacterium arenosum]MBJ6371976.1 16S rRNA (guanine(527)-N(7))-methyltransferase RsmG [Arenibacterium arenosum]